ncbi:MAG: Crp/Fnr family transcriptional regulator [Caldilineales bacterium]|nr:Crp/Fnr family transcriptional regulator [Caldilineales bacterium]
MNDKLKLLSCLELFRDLSAKELVFLESMTTISHVRKGRIFYRAEERGETLFVLRQGVVQLYRISPEGKKLIITKLNGNSVFGEMALFGNQIHHTFAEASDDCTVVVMDCQVLERLVLQNPQVGLRLIEMAGRRLEEAERRLEDMAFNRVPARIAALLLQLDANNTGEVVGITHLEIAETVGTYRETATQVLGEFKDAGIVRTARRRIRISDREGLVIIANNVNFQA